MVVGLGKQKGAESVHSDGLGNMARNLPANAKVVVENSNILFAIPCVENAYDETALIEAIPTEKSLSGSLSFLKIRIFQYAEASLVKEADVLVVNEIGRISGGTGVDPDISGTWSTEFRKRWAAGETDLLSGPAGQFSRKCKWNGTGRCNYKADFLINSIWMSIYTDCFTGTGLRSGMIPPVVMMIKKPSRPASRTANQD